MPFTTDERFELAIGFGTYFVTNIIALWLANCGWIKTALLGYTIQMYTSTAIGMVIMNEQPAHMVLAMANFVLLHAVVLGRQWALAVTAIMVALLLGTVTIGEIMDPTFTTMSSEGIFRRKLSNYTTLISLLTTAISTGYIVVTTFSLHEHNRAALVDAHHELESAKRHLQIRHDRAKVLSELGAFAAAATDLPSLKALAKQALSDGLGADDVALSVTSSAAPKGILIGSGPKSLVITPKRILPRDEMRFIRTLAGLLDGAYTRIVADLSLREANRFEGVGRVATSVAHDFNNLLMPICASYEIIHQADTISPRLKRIVKTGKAASEQAQLLVEKLLVHASSTDIKVEVVVLNRLLRERDMFLQSFVSGAASLNINCPPGEFYVMADRIELQQVLLNLTLNALSAIEQDGEVDINLSRGGQWAMLTVSDDGPGIELELREWVLKPFNSTTPAGSGLGLSTVDRIARAAGGSVEISATSSGGAMVIVRLPPARPGRANKTSSAQETFESVSITTLVVEDDERVRLILEEMLTTLGHKSIVVANGNAALAILAERPDINLVISDYQMPGLTGAQLIEKMSERNDFRPVILLSGYGPAIPQNVKTAPAACLSKPLSIDELNASIGRIANRLPRRSPKSTISRPA